MLARDIMTTNVISASPDATIVELAQLMLDRHISGIPIVDRDGQLVGMVTEGDCLRRAEFGTERKRTKWLEVFTSIDRLATDYLHSHGRKAGDVMSRSPICVGEDTPIEDIVTLMEKYRIKRVPVERDGKLVGIVSRANLLSLLVKLSHEPFEVPQGDAELRERVLAAFNSLPWAAGEFVSVTVKDGVVDLNGSYSVAKQHDALVVAAENVPGVKSVRNHLVWIEPMSGTVLLNPGA